MFHAERFDTAVSMGDRAAVLVSATYLELSLESAIRTHFVDITDDEDKALFGGLDRDSPLSNFGAKIRIGYALGVFGPLMRDDLKTIQIIRNCFAHTIEHIDLNSAEVAAAADVLNFPKYYKLKGGLMAKAIEQEMQSHKGKFVETCKWTSLRLLLGLPRAKGPVRIPDEFHYPGFSEPPSSPQTDG